MADDIEVDEPEKGERNSQRKVSSFSRFLISDTTVAQMWVLSQFIVENKSDQTQQGFANCVDVTCKFLRMLCKHVKPNYLHIKSQYK